MSNENIVLVNQILLQNIIHFLVKQPWKDVNEMINGLQQCKVVDKSTIKEIECSNSAEEASNL